MRFIIIFIVLSLTMTSCSTVNKSHPNSEIKINVVSDLDAKMRVDASKKLTGYASATYFLHLFKIGGDSEYVDGVNFTERGIARFMGFNGIVDKVKAAASYNAIKNSTADILVAPQYVITTNNWNPIYKHIKVKVTGYPGRVISIKDK